MQKISKNMWFLCNLSCGGLAKSKLTESDKKQCIKLGNKNKCLEIEIDQYCKVVDDSTKNYCTNRDINFDTTRYVCEMNTEYTKCSRRNKVCSDQGINNCEEFNSNCKKIKFSYETVKCGTVTIYPECQINNEGSCVNKNIFEDYKICSFNDDFTECQVKNKDCGLLQIIVIKVLSKWMVLNAN